MYTDVFDNMPTLLRYKYLLTGFSGGVFYGRCKWSLIEKVFNPKNSCKFPEINYN